MSDGLGLTDGRSALNKQARYASDNTFTTLSQGQNGLSSQPVMCASAITVTSIQNPTISS